MQNAGRSVNFMCDCAESSELHVAHGLHLGGSGAGVCGFRRASVLATVLRTSAACRAVSACSEFAMPAWARRASLDRACLLCLLPMFSMSPTCSPRLAQDHCAWLQSLRAVCRASSDAISQ